MTSRATLVLVLVLSAVAGLWAYGPLTAPQDPPPLPSDTLSAEVELLYARPFELDRPYTHAWRAEQPSVSSGLVLVLAVDPDVVAPRQTYEPVLFVGGQTAERLNTAQGSGHLVAIVPAAPGTDLSKLPIFFGEPALPEQIDAATTAAELARAVERQVATPPAALVAERSADPVRFADDYQLRLYAADLIEQWAPDEQDLVTGMRAPLLVR